MKNQNNQKLKVFFSLILGFVSIIFPIILNKIFHDIIPSFLMINLLISLIGVVIGMISLKSQLKIFAIIGIILCIMGLLETFFFYFILIAIRRWA